MLVWKHGFFQLKIKNQLNIQFREFTVCYTFLKPATYYVCFLKKNTLQCFFFKTPLTRVVCPKFEILKLRTQDRVCSCWRHATKKVNSPLEGWHNFKTTDSQFLKNIFIHAIINILTRQVIVRTLHRVTEIRVHYPTTYLVRFIYIYFLSKRLITEND